MMCVVIRKQPLSNGEPGTFSRLQPRLLTIGSKSRSPARTSSSSTAEMQKPPSRNANRNPPNHLESAPWNGSPERRSRTEPSRLTPRTQPSGECGNDLTGSPGTDGSNPVPSSEESSTAAIFLRCLEITETFLVAVIVVRIAREPAATAASMKASARSGAQHSCSGPAVKDAVACYFLTNTRKSRPHQAPGALRHVRPG
jgi:hypothetical protein